MPFADGFRSPWIGRSHDSGFPGWATAEVGGGDLARLTLVRQQRQKALGLA